MSATTPAAHLSGDQLGQPRACTHDLWCDGNHGEHLPDARGTFRPRLHRRHVLGPVSLERLELAPNERPRPGDEDTAVCVTRPDGNDIELTVDEAAQLAQALAAAVRVARGADL